MSHAIRLNELIFNIYAIQTPNTSYNKIKAWILVAPCITCTLPTQCIYIFHVSPTINTDCFPKQP